MAKIRTILGDIDAKEMGYTMPHEHILTSPKGHGTKVEEDHLLNDLEKAIQMCKEYKEIGGGTIVEATPESWGRNVPGMVVVSKETGVHIIACTGYICEEHGTMKEDVKDKTIDEVAAGFVRDIEVGMDGTTYKAGWIKAGTAYNHITEAEEKVIRAGARAATKTGVCLHFHTGVGTMGLEIIEILEDEGFDLTRAIISHVDRNPDYWYHKKMLEKGVSLIYDGPGKAKYYPDSMRVELIKKVVADGYEKQLMICNDMGRRSHHTVYGYGPGWQFIKQKFLLRLLEEGLTKENIDNFMIHNPARMYSLIEK
ncbi:phosphotriesterase family protein [Oceanivirga salmonicida]|uniref:phosphotriesterase family protein n=1 Tax=Oceanivirga salmonicida TaxID=1769291 RepID=UPI00082DFC8F|nr:hypothetical protein [Oceanivirga salmonicida]